MAILRELLEEKAPISRIAETYEIHPNDIYNWRKKLFESASDVFVPNKLWNNKTESEEKIKQLEDKLKKREGAISYLVQDNITLKKV